MKNVFKDVRSSWALSKINNDRWNWSGYQKFLNSWTSNNEFTNTFFTLVLDAVVERSEWLKLKLIPAFEFNFGRILLFDIQQTMSDGIASSITENINVNNIPNPIFWIGLVDKNGGMEIVEDYQPKILISWIPDELEDEIDGAISVIAESCLEWIEDSNSDYGMISGHDIEKILDAQKLTT